MKVLHITSIYPFSQDSYEGLFIKRHIDSLKEKVEQKVLVCQLLGSKHPGWSMKMVNGVFLSVIKAGWLPHRVVLWLNSFIILTFVLWYRLAKRFDIANFHLAYPNLVHVSWLKDALNMKFVITEHFSTYRRSYLKLPPKDVKRIQNIFHHQIPLIVVSQSLGRDIEAFAGIKQNFNVVNNVVDTNQFYFHNDVKPVAKQFIAIANWRPVKQPILLLEAFERAITEDSEITLNIGGEGDDFNKMKKYVKTHKLEKSIRFLGDLNPLEVADHLRTSSAMVLTSAYETFSVITAESLCCGTPVIVPLLDGLKEYLNDSNSIVCDEVSVEAFENAVLSYELEKYDRRKIGNRYSEVFNASTVGVAYYQVLCSL